MLLIQLYFYSPLINIIFFIDNFNISCLERSWKIKKVGWIYLEFQGIYNLIKMITLFDILLYILKIYFLR